MSEDASAGKLYADVVADVSGFRKDAETKLKKAVEGLRAEAKVKAAFSASQARIALNATLREVAKDTKVSAVKAKVAFDPVQVRSALNTALRAAAKGSDVPKVRVDVELNDARARTQLAQLGGRTKVTVDTEADTSGIERDVDKERKRQKSKPFTLDFKINGVGLSEAAGAVTSLLKFPTIAAGIGVAAGAVVNLAGGLVAMGSAASQAVGVLAALPNAVGVAAQGMGALLLGLSGVSEAVKALGKAQEATGASATASAGQQTAAAEAVRSAQERLTRAQEAAAERVREAQRRVMLAQEAAAERVRDAQEQLARSREQAAERAFDAERKLAETQAAGAQQIVNAEGRVTSAHVARQRAVESLREAIKGATEQAQDLALQLSGAALDEEGAEIALERAANRLRDITGSGSTASSLDKREADLAYRQAVQSLAEIRESNEDLAEEKAESDRKGIMGADQVVAAQERVTEATQDEAQAQRDLKATAVEVARDITEAQYELAKTQRDNARDIFSSQRNLYEAQRDGARSVVEAQRDLVQAQRDGARSVVDAQRDVARAMATSATATGGTSAAATALAAAMAKLSPEGQKFAKFIDGTLKPRFKELKFAVQEALLPGLQKAIKLGMPLLDVLEKGLVGSAKVISSLAVSFAKLVSAPEFKSDIGKIMASNNRAMGSFGKAGLAIVNILRKIAVVAGPVLLEPFAKWVRKLAEAANNSDKLSKSRITKFLKKAAATAKTLGKILGDTGKALSNVFGLSVPAGDNLLQSLADSAEAFRKATEDPENQERIKAFFDNTIPIMKQFGDLFNQVIALFLRFGEITGGNSLDGLFWILNRVLDVLEAITNIPGGGAAMTALLTLAGVGLGIGLVAKGVGSIVTNVARLAKFTGVSKVLGALGSAATNGLGVKTAAKLTAKQAGAAAKKGLSNTGSAIANAAGAVGGGVKKGAVKAGGAVRTGVSKAGGAIKTGAVKAGGAVARGGAALAGSAAGQAVAAGIARAGAAAKGAAVSVASYAAALAKSAGSAVLAGIKSAGTAIAGVAAAAGRGALALGALALSYARAGAAAALAGIKQLAMAAATGIVRAATVAWTAIQWLLNTALNANPISLVVLALAALVAGIVWAYNNVGWFRNAVDTAFKAIAAAGTWLWERVLKPVFQAVVGFVVNTLVPKILWLKSAWDVAWTAIGVLVSAAWNNVIKPLLNALIGFVTNTIIPKIQLLKSIWDTIWRTIGSILSSVWNSSIKPLLDKLVIFVTKTIPDGFKTGVALIKTFWDKLKEIAKSPVAFVVNTVWNKGLLPIWNWVADKINKSWKLDPITGFAGGGVVGYKRGGILPGTSSYKDGDDQLVPMRKGEGVYVSEAMRDPYERARLYAINQAAMSGKNLDAFRSQNGLATGGIVGFAGGGILSGVADFFKSAKDWFAEGMRSALTGAVNPIINYGRSAFGGTGFGNMAMDATQKITTGAIDHILGFENKLFSGDSAGVVKAAAKYIGQGDDRGMDNNNQFTRQWGWPAGTPWCALFASTAIKDAGAQKAYPGSPTAAVWTFNQRMKHVSPGAGKPGDLATYGSNAHVNIIEQPYGGGYKTIGGNEGPVVKRGVRFAPATVLRPAFARGGILDVFGMRNLDPADDKNPIVKLMRGLTPNVAGRVASALNQVPALTRDSGGALPPGSHLVHNRTGGTEWVLTPEAVRLLGGPKAVQELNDRAKVYQSGRSARASTTAPAAPGRHAAPPITQNIYPRANQSEHEIGMVAARKLGIMLR